MPANVGLPLKSFLYLFWVCINTPTSYTHSVHLFRQKIIFLLLLWLCKYDMTLMKSRARPETSLGDIHFTAPAVRRCVYSCSSTTLLILLSLVVFSFFFKENQCHAIQRSVTRTPMCRWWNDLFRRAGYKWRTRTISPCFVFQPSYSRALPSACDVLSVSESSADAFTYAFLRRNMGVCNDVCHST